MSVSVQVEKDKRAGVQNRADTRSENYRGIILN